MLLKSNQQLMATNPITMTVATDIVILITFPTFFPVSVHSTS